MSESDNTSPPEETRNPGSGNESETFQEQSSEQDVGLIREFGQFLNETKAWWLVPILLALALLGALVWLGGSSFAPFIYPLF